MFLDMHVALLFFCAQLDNPVSVTSLQLESAKALLTDNAKVWWPSLFPEITTIKKPKTGEQ